MAYSKKAKNLRRCTYRYPEGHERQGERCKAYARWASDWKSGNGLCVAHGTEGRGPEVHPRDRVEHQTVPLCDCPAYNWPHRPGSGCCRWPDPPLYRYTIPEGTRAAWRKGRGGRWFRMSGYPRKKQRYSARSGASRGRFRNNPIDMAEAGAALAQVVTL